MSGKILNAFGKPALYHGPGTRGFYGNGYQGSAFSSERSFIPGGIFDARKELTPYTRLEMVRKARFFKKNSGLARSVCLSIVEQAIGDGIVPIPDTGDDDANEKYLEYFHEVAKVAHVGGRFDFWEGQRQHCGLNFWDGECFVNQVKSKSSFPQFQFIRTHNVGNFDIDASNDDWIDGIKFDKVGRARFYRVRQRDGSVVSIPARSIIHAPLWEDADAPRGVTALFYALNTVHDIHDLLSLEKQAVKQNSRIAHTIAQDNPDDMGATSDADHFIQATLNTDGKPEAIPLSKIYGGEVLHLGKGEKLEAWQSNRPSSTFTGFLGFLGRLFTGGCGMPFEFAWDPKGISGPGQRSVLEQVDRAAARWRRPTIAMTRRFYTFVIGTGIANR